jgi:hypothetical protein
VERGGGWLVVVGTLLGPEGADPRAGCMRVRAVGGVGCLVSGPSGSSYHPLVCVPPVGGARGVGLAGAVPEGGRLYVENCTVDASIFFDCRARTRRVWGLL